MWRGKKAAILSPDPLPVGAELEVATGDERFGTVVLGDPARMLASEADRKEYVELHRVWPREREAWWPGETRFNFYPVESFDPYREIHRAWALKETGPGEPDCPMCVNEGGGWCRLHDELVQAGKSCGDWQPFEDWRGESLGTSDGRVEGRKEDNVAAVAPGVPQDPQKFWTSEKAHTGAIVALFLRPGDAGRFALDGGEKPEDLHLTLAYLGEAKDLDRALAGAVVGKLAAETKPLRGRIQGYGVFKDTPDGDVVYASFDAKELPALRQELVEKLAAAGYEVQGEHGFTPHITLAYVESGSIPVADIATGDILFPALTLAWAGKRTTFPFQGTKEAEVMPYEKFKDGDKWCVRKADSKKLLHCYTGDGAEGKADKYLRALYANVEDAGKEVDPLEFEEQEKDLPVDPEEMIEIAKAAQEIVTDEPVIELSEEQKQRILDGILDLAAKDEAETVDPEEEDEKAGNIEGLAKHLSKKLGGDPHFFTKCMADEELAGYDEDARAGICAKAHKLALGFWPGEHGGENPEGPKGADEPAEDEKDVPCPKREKKPGVGERLKAALRSLLRPEDQGSSIADAIKAHGDAGLLLKSVNGEPWIVTWSSNAFVDRDDEMFSTQGLERYVQAAEKKQDRGQFNFWHVPRTDFAEKRWQGVIGRFLVEAGPFLDTPTGRAAKKFFTDHPEGHPEIAPEGWGCSVEYRYLPEQKKERVYEDFWVTRTSVLPRLAAANTRTRGGVTMALTEAQRKALTEIFPDEADGLIQETEAESKRLEEAGVEHKALSPEKAAAALRKLAGDTKDESLKGKLEELAKAMWEEKPDEGEDEEEMDEEKEVQEKQAEIDVEALAAEMVKHFDVQLQPLQELQEMAERQAAEIAELKAALKQREAREEKRKEAELPRMVLSLEKRASSAPETALEEEDPLMKSKPAEPKKSPDGSGAQHFFPAK